MGDKTAFFYGTLMAPEVLHRVCHGTPKPLPYQTEHLTIRPAILHSYSRHKVSGCDYPAIVPEPSASVRGTLVKGLTDMDIWRLDIFEGSEYKREDVSVSLLTEVGDESGKGNVEGEKVDAQVYVWIGDPADLEPGEWDFGNFVKEKMKHWVGADDEYEEVDEAVKDRDAKSDPTGGRGKGGGITEALEKNGEAKDEVLGSAV